MFIASFRSNGYDIARVNDVFGEATDDGTLPEYCADQGHLFVTNDKNDFSGTIGDRVTHAGVIIYTDPVFLRDELKPAVRGLDRVLTHYPPEELTGETIWID